MGNKLLGKAVFSVAKFFRSREKIYRIPEYWRVEWEPPLNNLYDFKTCCFYFPL
jgi:hypothetical protein